ncbi:hypothetical protein H4219_003816 [Mycoemilia scoparia]|uniref:GOST seven transmembrane domain-containing protein n=1 Tax=Mycoemilia scoparia TaxID=417184 RepID=A0A9W8A1N5_9FUNG|nr:hypothetical protein H4219_003816 [Mycoemilia scoparia]
MLGSETANLNRNYANGFKCAPIAGSSKSKESKLMVKFPAPQFGSVSIQIFEWNEKKRIGKLVPEKALPNDKLPKEPSSGNEGAVVVDIDGTRGTYFLYCDDQAIALELCSERNRGQAVIDYRDPDGKPYKFGAAIFNDYIKMQNEKPGNGSIEYWRWKDEHGNGSTRSDDEDGWAQQVTKAREFTENGAQVKWEANGQLTINYRVNTTGFYCVQATSEDYFTADASWINSTGELSYAEYPKIIFYGAMTIVYLIIAGVWAYFSWRVWKDILPVQNMLLGLICLMVIDMGVSNGFWSYYNRTGVTSVAWTVVMVLLDAGRNSLSFFLLLVVALGWGVLRPSLGPTMKKCIALGVFHFLAGCLYGFGVVFRPPQDNRPISIMYVLPLSIAMAVFYMWTLHALFNTIKSFESNSQSYKLAMYQRLWILFIVSLLFLIGFFSLNIINLTMLTSDAWAARQWRWRWFLSDGFFNLEYLFIFGTILFWWRPTAENRRYGLEQIAGDEDGALERERHRQLNGDEFDENGHPISHEGIPMDDFTKPQNDPSDDTYQRLPDDVFVLEDEDDYLSDDFESPQTLRHNNNNNQQSSSTNVAGHSRKNS